MKFRFVPNLHGSAGELALGLFALLCIGYAIYVTFLMPPLVRYGNAGAKADGRMYCSHQRLIDQNRSYAQYFPDGKGGISLQKMNQPDARIMREVVFEVAQSGEKDCLSEAAVNTPLLVFKAVTLFILGAVSCAIAVRSRRASVKLNNSLLRVVFGSIALLCALYALYVALLMPPLVTYGTAGGIADGRALCPVVGRRAANARASAKAADGNPFSDLMYSDQHKEEMQQVTREAETACLSETAINTSLLVFRTTVLLAIGAVFVLLASRLRVDQPSET